MEELRAAQEILGDLRTIEPEKIGGAVLALPNEEQATLRAAVLPRRDELQAHIESLADDPDLGTA